MINIHSCIKTEVSFSSFQNQINLIKQNYQLDKGSVTTGKAVLLYFFTFNKPAEMKHCEQSK